ncbi:MAG: gramicidin dehydrogenase [Clostridiales bacterium]|jgi:surfactin synthase thioesterase subunit|nr:gramicidin dehydrogenase [Clostridiales bacterium]
MLLYCVPHAGASAMNFLKWKPLLEKSVSLIPLELAGRGNKQNQSVYTNFSEAVYDIFEDFKRTYHGQPFALYGHSLGGWLVYELYYYIKNIMNVLPNHIFFSGINPPDVAKDGIEDILIQDNLLTNMINEYHGNEIDSLDSKLLNYFENILMSDLMLIKNYRYEKKQELIIPPITILSGMCDSKTTNQQLLRWKSFASNKCTFCKIEGNHFFPFNNTRATLTILNSILLDA